MSSDQNDGVYLPYPIESLVRRGREAVPSFEYRCNLRRLYPWPAHVNTKRPLTEFGCALGEVPPGTIVDRHCHDEEETLIVLSGRGSFTIADQTTKLEPRDVIYIPRLMPHEIHNQSQTESLLLMDIYWDMGGASEVSFPNSSRFIRESLE